MRLGRDGYSRGTSVHSQMMSIGSETWDIILLLQKPRPFLNSIG
jgi:hypothetical protein